MHIYYKYYKVIHNKIRNCLFNLLSNYISAILALLILHIKDECTFSFLNFLRTGLCISFVNSLFCAISLSIAPPEVSELELFYLKIYKPFK